MECSGPKLTVRNCLDADETRKQAMNHIPANKHDATNAQFTSRRQRLADTGQLRTPEFFNKEGKLPDGKDFYAIKTQTRLRAYGWFSTRLKSVFFISHFAFKRGEKLSQSDTHTVVGNWRRIEEGGENE